MGYKVKKIYVGTQQVRPRAWTPDASRTLLYLPLESNATDYSGNNRTTSATSVTYTTVGGVQSAHVGTTGGIAVTPRTFLDYNQTQGTVSFLYYKTSNPTTQKELLAFVNYNYSFLNFRFNSSKLQCVFGGDGVVDIASPIPAANQWHHILATGDTTNGSRIFIDGVKVLTRSYPGTHFRGTWSNNSENGYIVMNVRNGVGDSRALDGNMRELFIENKVWTDDECTTYYQQIKSKLGI